MSFSNAKVALVFDWMTTKGGAEKVNLQLHKIFPEADIYSCIFDRERHPEFAAAKIHTSALQNLPFAKSNHQIYLSCMPHAYEAMDLSDYDIVISSSHSCSKGVITKPGTMHISYCHSPMRYAWDGWQSYIKDYPMNPVSKLLAKRQIHNIRMWDKAAADRVDHFIANSSTTQKRISKYYRRNSEVIHPSIQCSKIKPGQKTEGYYLAVGRLTPYKRFDLVVETFNKIGLPIKIVGTGVELEKLKAEARGNIEFLEYVDDKELSQLYANCEALIFPQLEDFGLTPIEAMAAGRPVIAFGEGGATDSIIEDKTGIFFGKQTPESLKKAIKYYSENKRKFKRITIRKHAEGFDNKHFRKNIKSFVRNKWETWSS